MNYLLDEVEYNYLKQRRQNSSQVTLDFTSDISFQTEQLIDLLRTGDCTEDRLLSMFDNDLDIQQYQQKFKSEIVVNEQFTGKTLTHFTLNVSINSISAEQITDLLCFIDLCPNLEYLNLNLSSIGRYDFSKVNLSKKLILLKKLKILVLNLKYNGVTEQQLSQLAQDISKIETLIELNIFTEQVSPISWNSLYVAFSDHRTLNTLKIKSQGDTDRDMKIFKNNYKKMKRLVCKDLIYFVEEEDYDVDLAFDLFG